MEMDGYAEEPVEEGPARQQWDNPLEFQLSCIAISVGLGGGSRSPPMRTVVEPS